jgi:predicted DNA-binding transcriptional regulator AlpA
VILQVNTLAQCALTRNCVDVVVQKEPQVTVNETVAPLTVDVPTAARMLGISRGGAYELARRGELPGAIKLGGRTVVSRRALERALNGESTAAS